MAKLLVCDDEEKITDLIEKYAIFEGHTVTKAVDGVTAVRSAKEDNFDLVLMDVMMPGLDGFSAVREIRMESDIPVIMLSARGEEYDRIHGFEVGADDYVVKPFSPKELMLRIDAVLKRVARKTKSNHDVYEEDGICIDFTSRKVFVDGSEVDFALKEFDLLAFMVNNKDVALSREKLLAHVWGEDFYGDDRTLDTHIKLLRRSLGKYAAHIVTLRGVGYRFDSEI